MLAHVVDVFETMYRQVLEAFNDAILGRRAYLGDLANDFVGGAFGLV